LKKPIISFAYEIILAGLIIFTLVVKLPEQQDYYLSWFVWALFLIDYVVRLVLSEKKWEYIKSHPLELLAIIPFDQIFRTLRLVRLVRLIRLLVLIRRKNSFIEVLTNKYKIDRIFIVVVSLLFISAIPMYWIEPNFKTYGDALWWAVVTTTTVGYGDLYPETSAGRLIAGVLMFVGIGLIGVVTGTVASLFGRGKDLPEELEYVRKKIDDHPEITSEELDLMINKLMIMKAKKEHNA